MPTDLKDLLAGFEDDLGDDTPDIDSVLLGAQVSAEVNMMK